MTMTKLGSPDSVCCVHSAVFQVVIVEVEECCYGRGIWMYLHIQSLSFA